MDFSTGCDRPVEAQLTGKKRKHSADGIYSSGQEDSSDRGRVTESAITSVPESYYEASLGLGATHSQSVFFAVVPAAKSGIPGRYRSWHRTRHRRTMAVIMIAGNQPRMPKRNHRRPSYHDSQYCTGDGICIRTSPGSADCNGCCAVCLYPADQFIGVYAEPEGTLW